MANHTYHSVREFAKIIYKVLKTDRGVNIACSGDTGEGKSTFTIQLMKEYAKVSGMNWSYDNITWSRDELKVWIDGEGEEQKGRKPEYSPILADEMINMFFNQEWNDPEQMDMIKTLNQCRDRHLFFAGNNPSFFDLNPKVRDRFTFFAFVHERGKAWIFIPEKNPFTKDKWNALDNIKLFRKWKHPYHSHNFAFEVLYDDLEDGEKQKYLAIRNKKRVESLDETREKRDFKNAGKRDYVLGRLVVYFKDDLGYSEHKISNLVGVHPNTIKTYVNIGMAQKKKK